VFFDLGSHLRDGESRRLQTVASGLSSHGESLSV
jgi:hypothetical protein